MGDFLRDYVTLGNGYTVCMALGIAPVSLAFAIGAVIVAVLMIAGCAWFIRRRPGGAENVRLGLFLGGACFALFSIRGGLTRSDFNHVLTGAFPCSFLIYAGVAALIVTYRRPLLLIPCLALPFYVPYFQGAPLGNLKDGAGRLQSALLRSFIPTTLQISNPKLLEGIGAAQSWPGKSLFVWPYESMVTTAVGKLNPDYTTQNFSAHTEALEQKTVGLLKANPDTGVVLYTDTDPVDGVPHLTRNPVIFRYLMEHYQVEAAKMHGALLTPLPAGSERHWRETVLPVGGANWTPSLDAPLVIKRNDGKPLCRRNNLLVLRMTCPKTRMLPVGKPGHFFVSFCFSSRAAYSCKFLLPPDGQSHDVLLTGLGTKDTAVLNFFDSGAQLDESEPVSRLEVRWLPMDLMTSRPNSINLERVSVLQRGTP